MNRSPSRLSFEYPGSAGAGPRQDMITQLSSGKAEAGGQELHALCGAGEPIRALVCKHQTLTRPVWAEKNLVKGHGDNRRISGNTDEAASENGLEEEDKAQIMLQTAWLPLWTPKMVACDTDTSQNTGHCCHSCQNGQATAPASQRHLLPGRVQGRSIWLAESRSSACALFAKELGRQAFSASVVGGGLNLPPGCKGWGIFTPQSPEGLGSFW